MKCKAYIQTYKGGSKTIPFDADGLETIEADGELAVSEWEKENNDTSYRESYEDEDGNLY